MDSVLQRDEESGDAKEEVKAEEDESDDISRVEDDSRDAYSGDDAIRKTDSRDKTLVRPTFDVNTREDVKSSKEPTS